MLKLSNSPIVFFYILLVFLLGCDGGKSNNKTQKTFADSLELDICVNTEEKTGNYPEVEFSISIEGYEGTLLSQAVYEGDTVQIHTLTSNGASIERCLTDGTYIFDILYAAFVFNKVDVFRYIIRNKLYSDINKTYTEEAESPLSLACNLPDCDEAIEITRILLELGANADGVGDSGGEQTIYPINIAVTRNNVGLTKLLIEHGANKNVTNMQGETPLVIAQKNSNKEIVAILSNN